MMYSASAFYPLDNSAMVHLAAHTRQYSNTFRLSVTLTEPLDPGLLQEAVRIAAPRFPTIVAGIQPGPFRFHVRPCPVPPSVAEDKQTLAHMSKAEIEACALRVLYKGATLSVEVFHSLTDGCGALSFMKTLLAEYLRLSKGVRCEAGGGLLLAGAAPKAEELADSYAFYAGGPAARRSATPSYQLPGAATAPLQVTTMICPLAEALAAARRHHGTLTSFLSAVMASAIMELQAAYSAGHKKQPVQIMIPVDLRRHFPSESLRNFSLFTFAAMQPEQSALPLAALTEQMQAQQARQLTHKALQGAITANVRLEQNPLVKSLPLKLKCAALKKAFARFGAKTSSISISNLGAICFPEALQPYIRRVGFLLSPRLCSPYNCGVVSCGEQLYIGFTRNCRDPALESLFLQKLRQAGLEPLVESGDTTNAFA